MFEAFSCTSKASAEQASAGPGDPENRALAKAKLSSSPVSPLAASRKSESASKRQKTKADLTNAPGLPARLGCSPLRLIVVGANPSEHAWLSGHYYSNPGNWMWRILKETGIAPSTIRGSMDDELMQREAGVGFIDIGVGHPCTQLSAISSETFQSWIETFYRLLMDHVQQACESGGCICGRCGCPSIVAFSGKRQFMELMNFGRARRDRLKKLDTGQQLEGPAGWPLPPSTQLQPDIATRLCLMSGTVVHDKLDKPRSLISADSVGTHHYLELPVLLGKTSTSFLQPVSFFVSWQGVLTLAYRGFPPPIVSLKRQIEASHPGLNTENPGSRWPKTSLGALKDDKRLTPDQLKCLNSICERESVIFTAGDDALRVRMDTAGVALYECRSCEKLLSYQESKLDQNIDSSEASVEEQGRVQHILTEAHDPNYWFSVSKDGNRETHYRGPHLGASLIHKLRSGSPAGHTNRSGLAHAVLFGTINHFRKKVEEELPGLYAWFSDESLHVTFRALMG
ncbi:hypothetical protein WJX84_005361 [Apatococcus fuscideae]|uniref:Uracil-DNA glycosylase-like domain-containing protein n=1 Tax=Apatococcus fuscideae TaxID=2026836 RepID=A0AAW1TDQ6_9CHLO